jgi:aspartyl protease family protein
VRNKICWLIFTLCLATGSFSAELSSKLAAIALFKNKAVLSIDGKRHTLSVGDHVAGVTLLAADADSATVSVDNQKVQLRLDGRIGSTFATAPTQILRLTPGDGGHYFVDGKIEGNSVAFMVDTGATHIAINKHTAKRLGLLYRTDGRPGRIETASGVVTAYYMHFASVKVQNLELRNVEGVVVDSDFPSVALLGQSFLNRLDMRRDGALLELRAR